MNRRANEKCKTCVYRAADTDPNNCDYALVTKKCRGCSVSECDKYIKGDRIGIIDHFQHPLPGTIY